MESNLLSGNNLQSGLRSKPLNLLGIAKKAGLLVIGSDAVKAATRNGKAELIILADDISIGSARQAQYSADDSGTFCVSSPYTKFELGNVTGRGSPGTLAFIDIGLAEGFMKRLSELDEDRYKNIHEALTDKMRTRKQKTGKGRTKI